MCNPVNRFRSVPTENLYIGMPASDAEEYLDYESVSTPEWT